VGVCGVNRGDNVAHVDGEERNPHFRHVPAPLPGFGPSQFKSSVHNPPATLNVEVKAQLMRLNFQAGHVLESTLMKGAGIWPQRATVTIP
jgi:hypothetical protein